jgi:hypothetical protein
LEKIEPRPHRRVGHGYAERCVRESSDRGRPREGRRYFFRGRAAPSAHLRRSPSVLSACETAGDRSTSCRCSPGSSGRCWISAPAF